MLTIHTYIALPFAAQEARAAVGNTAFSGAMPPPRK